MERLVFSADAASTGYLNGELAEEMDREMKLFLADSQGVPLFRDSIQSNDLQIDLFHDTNQLNVLIEVMKVPIGLPILPFRFPTF